MAALDGLPDKVYDLRMKHYGDKTAEQKVIDKRVENYKFVSSMLLRDITVALAEFKNTGAHNLP